MSNWEIPVEYLAAASVAPPTATISGVEDHLRVVDEHALQVEASSFTGSFLIVQLQGSLDGVGWYVLTAVNPNSNNTFFSDVSGVPARYTRVLAEPEDGSTSGTVTVTAVSGIL